MSAKVETGWVLADEEAAKGFAWRKRKGPVAPEGWVCEECGMKALFGFQAHFYDCPTLRSGDAG